MELFESGELYFSLVGLEVCGFLERDEGVDWLVFGFCVWIDMSDISEQKYGQECGRRRTMHSVASILFRIPVFVFLSCSFGNHISCILEEEDVVSVNTKRRG